MAMDNGGRVETDSLTMKERIEAERQRLVIYVATHCGSCAYAYRVADEIRNSFPTVDVELVDIEVTPEVIPDEVFATPTYMLNGRIWSLGNPSEKMICDAFGEGAD